MSVLLQREQAVHLLQEVLARIEIQETRIEALEAMLETYKTMVKELEQSIKELHSKY